MRAEPPRCRCAGTRPASRPRWLHPPPGSRHPHGPGGVCGAPSGRRVSRRVPGRGLIRVHLTSTPLSTSAPPPGRGPRRRGRRMTLRPLVPCRSGLSSACAEGLPQSSVPAGAQTGGGFLVGSQRCKPSAHPAPPEGLAGRSGTHWISGRPASIGRRIPAVRSSCWNGPVDQEDGTGNAKAPRCQRGASPCDDSDRRPDQQTAIRMLPHVRASRRTSTPD